MTTDVQHTTTVVDGTPVHALARRAPGRTAVCVHGVGVSSRYFTATLDVLGAQFDIHAPDLPGGGHDVCNASVRHHEEGIRHDPHGSRPQPRQHARPRT